MLRRLGACSDRLERSARAANGRGDQGDRPYGIGHDPARLNEQKAFQMSGMQHLFQLDHSLSAWFVAHRWSPLTGVMEVVSVAGRDGLLWGAIGAVLALAGRLDVRGLLQLWAALALALIVSDDVVKPLAARERPFRSN